MSDNMKKTDVSGSAVSRVLRSLREGTMSPYEANALMSHFASWGSPKAQFYLALFLHDGTGCQRDDAKALEYLRESAKSGNLNAAATLGEYLVNGTLGVTDATGGHRLLRDAAVDGSRKAAELLVRYYTDGVGVEKDAARADFWKMVLELNSWEPGPGQRALG